MPNNIIKQDYGSLGNDVQTQMLIAPVLATMVSDRAYAVGEQFIVNSVLYKITQAVSAAGVALVVGSNCKVSDTITQQIKGFDDSISITNSTGGNGTIEAYRKGNVVTLIIQGTFNNISNTSTYTQLGSFNENANTKKYRPAFSGHKYLDCISFFTIETTNEGINYLIDLNMSNIQARINHASASNLSIYQVITYVVDTNI
jgi:hypothetical protein